MTDVNALPKPLTRRKRKGNDPHRSRNLFYWDKDDETVFGPNPNMSGNYTSLRGNCTDLSGDCTALWGDCTGLSGDCTGLKGNCTNLMGNLSDIPAITSARAEHLNLAFWVKKADS